MSNATTLHGLGELVAYLPYALGFRPRESLVVVTHAAHGLGVIARCDLTADNEEFSGTITHLGARLERHQPRGFDLVVLTDRQPSTLGPQLACAGSVLDAIATVRHLVWAPNSGAAWSVGRCDCGRACALDTRRPVPADHQVAAVVDRVVEGVRPLAGREELARLVAQDRPLSDAVAGMLRRDHGPGHAPGVCRHALRDLLAEPAWSAQARDHHDDLAARVAPILCALTDTQVRDATLAWMAPDMFDDIDARTAPHGPTPTEEEPAAAAELAGRLRLLLTAAPSGSVPDAAALLAFWQWRRGDGAAASVAVQRGLAEQQDHRLCGLIAAVLDSGMGPHRWHRPRPVQAPSVGG